MEAGVSVLSWNVYGLTTNKLEDTDFLNSICKYDISFLYESWTQKKSDIDINVYKCFNLYKKFQNRRANRCSGVIVLYIRDSISDGVKLVRNHYDSMIWIELDKNFFNIESDIYIAGLG